MVTALLKKLLKKVMSGKDSDKEGQTMAKTKTSKAAGKSASKAPAKAAAKKPAPAKKPATKAQAPKAQAKAPAKVAPKAKVEEKNKKAVVVAKPAPAAPKVSPKPTPTLASAKPAVKAPKVIERDDVDDAPSKPVRMGTSTDLFTEEELTTFRNLLNEEKRKILAKARAATASGNIALEKDEMYDEVDLASATVEQNLTLRLLDRDRKLLAEIDHAIDKIDTGDYGFCEGTGEAIPKRRLELRPWCRHSVKYKEQLERMKKSGRGVADEDEAF